MGRKTLLGTVLALGLTAGCNDGKVDETHQGTLESGDEVVTNDNSFFDPYTFETKAGSQIEITMTSSEFDTYLMLTDPNDTKIGENDDTNGTDAAISMVAPADGVYTVLANSKTSGMTGNYTLHIKATPPAE